MRIQSVATILVVCFSAIYSTKYDCDKSEIINQKHIHVCCKHPDGHNDVTEMCAKKTGFKLPSKVEESVLDLTGENLISGTCFGKCVFDEWKVMKDNQLDMIALKKLFESKFSNDPEYVKEMVTAFDHCHSKSEERMAKFMDNPIVKSQVENFCPPMPSVILACVIKKFFHNCPANRWTNNVECQTAKEFGVQCPESLTVL